MAEEERPWYLTQSEEPGQAVSSGGGQSEVMAGRSPDEIAESSYANAAPQGDSSSLIGALGGAAQAPAGGSALLLPLLMAQMQQRQQAASSPLGAFANAYAAARGQPSPLQPVQAASQYQQFQMIHDVLKDQALEKERTARLTLAQAAQQRLQDVQSDKKAQQDRETVRKEAMFLVAQGKPMLAADDPVVRQAGAQNFLKGLTDLGFQADKPEALVAALGNGQLTHEKLGKALDELYQGIPPDAVQARYGLSPEMLQDLQGKPLQLLTDKNTVELKTKAADQRIKEAQAINDENPEFKAEPKLIPFIMERARSLYGLSYQDLDKTQKANVMKTAQVDANADALKQYGAQQQIQLQKAQQLAGTHFGYQLQLANAEQRGIFQPVGMDTKNVWVDDQGKPAQGDELLLNQQQAFNKGLRPMSQKEADTQNQFQAAQQMLENMKYTHDQMVKNGLYSGTWRPGPLGIGAAVENVYKSGILPKIGDTETDRAILRNFDSQKGELVAIMRGLGDKVRAMAALTPTVSILGPTTGQQGVELTLSQIEKTLKEQHTLMRLPGTFETKQSWTAPTLKKGQTTPDQMGTGSPDLSKRPISRSAFNNAVARGADPATLMQTYRIAGE